MRVGLAAIVIVVSAIIGGAAVESVNKMQDSKMQRFCQSVPVGASYDDVCATYRQQGTVKGVAH